VWGLGGAGVGLGALGFGWPAALRPLFTAWMVVAFPIGWTVSRVLLAAVYFLLFTPLAILFRIQRRDALRRPPSSVASYWLAKAPMSDSARYFRQF